MEAERERREFRLAGNSTAGFVSAFLLLICVIGQVVNVAVLTAGIVEAKTAVITFIFLVAAPAAAIWNLRGMSQGVAKLTASRLEVTTAVGRHLYKWEDVLDIGLEDPKSLSSLNLLRSTGWSTKAHPLVKVKLRRSLRLGPLPGRFGTDITGLPSLVFKSVRFNLEDPEGFVRAAHSYLRF